MSCFAHSQVVFNNLPLKAVPCQWSDVLNAPVWSQAVTAVNLLAVLLAEASARKKEGHSAGTDLACSRDSWATSSGTGKKVRLCLLGFGKCVRGLMWLHGEDGKSQAWNHFLHRVIEISYFCDPNPVLAVPGWKKNTQAKCL